MHQCKDYFDRLENVVMGPTPTNLVSNIKMSWRFSTNQLQHVWHVNWLTGVKKGEGAQVVLTTWHFKSSQGKQAGCCWPTTAAPADRRVPQWTAQQEQTALTARLLHIKNPPHKNAASHTLIRTIHKELELEMSHELFRFPGMWSWFSVKAISDLLPFFHTM